MPKNDDKEEKDDEVIERRLRELAEQTPEYPPELKKGTELEFKFRIQQINKNADKDNEEGKDKTK